MDYKFGPKNNWRRWAWNRIVELLWVPTKDAVVLYLAGPDDLDRPIALSHGFKAHNLIAIERDTRLKDSLRNEGVNTIHGGLAEACITWSGQPLMAHVLLADVCCGYTAEMSVLFNTLPLLPTFSRCVIAANLQRGREMWPEGTKRPDVKHRGHAVFGANTVMCARYLHETQGVQMDDALKRLGVLARPKFNTYKSSKGMLFDSAVWRNRSVYNYTKDTNQVEQYMESIGIRQVECVDKASADSFYTIRHIKPKIAAAKAIRTMRLQAA